MSKWISGILEWIREFINARVRVIPDSATLREAAGQSDDGRTPTPSEQQEQGNTQSSFDE